MIYKLKRILARQSVVRAMMDEEMKKFKASGRTIDIGGARNPEYIQSLKKDKYFKLEIIDGLLNPINFETDTLPFDEYAFNTALMCNVLEHIYNHNFLTREVYRILKPGGKLIGFVPFLIQYHPDPFDYFRYTDEALRKIFNEAGFKNIYIAPVGMGLFMVNCNNLLQRLPLIIRPIYFLWNYMLDSIYIKIKPNIRKHFPLGYIFEVEK